MSSISIAIRNTLHHLNLYYYLTKEGTGILFFMLF